jgi:hypothetical protein
MRTVRLVFVFGWSLLVASCSGHREGSANDSQDGQEANLDGATVRLVVGPGIHPGNTAHVRVLDGSGTAQRELHDVFAASRYGANVAACDVDGDGASEILVAKGPGPDNDSTVRILRADGSLVSELPTPFGAARYGATVACGGGKLVVGLGAGPDNDSRVRVYDARTLAFEREIKAYDPGARFGTRVAVGDVDGDGKPEIVTAPGPSPSSGAHVKVFALNGTLRGDVQAFEPDPIYGDKSAPFGASIAVGDLDGDGKAEIIVAPGPAPLATPTVRTYSSAAPGPLVKRGEFTALLPTKHLQSYGYFHVHDPHFGLHISDVKDFTNVAHLWDPQYLPTARDAGMKVLLDLENYIASKPVDTWEATLQSIAPGILANKDVIAAIYAFDEPDGRGVPLATQSKALQLVHRYLPGIPTVMTYSRTTGAVPPELDWVSIDPYIGGKTFDNTGCNSRDHFNWPESRLAWAAKTGKPVFLIGDSYGRSKPLPVHLMPSLCQQRWYAEAAISNPSVQGLIWFMYGHVRFEDRGEEIQGAGEQPDHVAWHRRLSGPLLHGGFGAQLAIGDLDGDGKPEVIVGQGLGTGSEATVQLYTPDGTKKGELAAYATATMGASLAVGRFAGP